jgi:hypothetical protein
MGDKNRGLYEKFSVIRTDGQSAEGEKHEHCKYFIIDLDCDEFAADTIRKYADLCSAKYPALSQDLVDMSAQIRLSKLKSFLND